MKDKERSLLLSRKNMMIRIEGGVLAAPMAGALEPPYRKVLHFNGCPFSFTEMIGSRGLVEETGKTLEIASWDQKWGRCGAQLLGSDPEYLFEASVKLEKMGFPLLDLNSGCPKRKVLRSGGGGALLKDPDLLLRCLSSILDATGIPVGIKIRAGWREYDRKAFTSLLKDIEGSGVSYIAIHPRTVVQGFSGEADHGITELASDSVDVPVIGSGDVMNRDDADEILQRGISGVMVGRALLGDPLWFKNNSPGPNRQSDEDGDPMVERLELAVKHLGENVMFYGERAGVVGFRKHLSWYLKGIRGKGRYLEEAYSIKRAPELERFIYDIIHDLDRDIAPTISHMANN